MELTNFTTARGQNPVGSLLSQIKLYWNMATPICLTILSGCFSVDEEDLNS